MTVKISIPAGEIIKLKHDPLVLENAKRCSRCDTSPADYYEVHRLFFQAGQKKYRRFGRKYEIDQDYRLKINICETCYQTDFLTHPETLDRNGSTLGRIVRFHSITWMLGALMAGIGFLLLTPIVPDTAAFHPIKSFWQFPVAMGAVVLLLTWLSQKKYQTQTMRALEKKKPGFFRKTRAMTKTPILESNQDLSSTALEITMDNELWAEQVAAIHGWSIEKTASSAGIIPNSEE